MLYKKIVKFVIIFFLSIQKIEVLLYVWTEKCSNISFVAKLSPNSNIVQLLSRYKSFSCGRLSYVVEKEKTQLSITKKKTLLKQYNFQNIIYPNRIPHQTHTSTESINTNTEFRTLIPQFSPV